jgi:hypothetical protein
LRHVAWGSARVWLRSHNVFEGSFLLGLSFVLVDESCAIPPSMLGIRLCARIILIPGDTMQILGNSVARITRFVCKLRGGSQSILAEASDGLLYVVKFINNLQGPNLLFNEAVGTELYRACGLPVPIWKPLLISDSFLDANQNCWIQMPEGSLRPAAGLCFGSQFLNGSGKHILEILPGNSFKRVSERANFWLAWAIDICFDHLDNRQALFLQRANGGLDAYFVDHGSLFGGPNGDQTPAFRASRYLDPRIYPWVSSQQLSDLQGVAGNLNSDGIWQTIGMLPDEWKTASALRRFAQCLERLSEPDYLQSVMDTILEGEQRASQFETGDFLSGRKPALPILRTGIPGAESDQIWDDHPACA